MSRPCPNPACLGIVQQANTYVHQKLAGRLAPNYTPLFTSEAYGTVRTQMIAALAAGDLDQTKVAAREWCKLVVRWTDHHTEAGILK